MMSEQRQRLLVNYWYAPPIGHAIEGLRYALGHHAADPELQISLLLNAATPTELARCCPFLENVFAVPYTGFVRAEGDPAAALAGIPRSWDYVVENHRARDAGHDEFAGFRAFFDAAARHFEPRFGLGVAGHSPPGYLRHQELRLDLPADAREAARRAIGQDRRAISVVLAGSSSERHLYPSVSSWKLILTELSAQYPDAKICLIGKWGVDGRTTSCIGRSEIRRLIEAVPASIECFDRPILEQIALVEASALLVSPHTGFAFTASTVGTAWLAISGGNWHEYFFNGVPVYSLLPDTTRYPCFAWAELGPAPLPILSADDDGEGPRTPSMSAARIREDLPELLHAAALLIERRLPYEEALAAYFPRLLSAYRGDRSRIFSFDDIHKDYLP